MLYFLDYLKLRKNYKRGISVGCLISITYVIIKLAVACLSKNLNVNFNIGLMWWIGGITVGFIEEIPLRGFLLTKLEGKIGFILSNIIVTIIFVMMHFPKWITMGTYIMPASIKIAIVSLLFGYLVKRYDSLWVTIICHSVFDICFFIGL